jgi:DHA3 family tetracycline resistance protein-like MFS transporter
VANGISIASAAIALPVLIKSLDLDMGYFGMCQSCLAVGALIASIWMGKHVATQRRGRLAYFMCLAIGCCIAVVGLPITIYGIAFAWLLRGMAYVLFRLIWVGTLQQLVPRDLLGRVATVDSFLQVIISVVTFVIYGWLTETVHAEAVFIVGGMVPIVTAILAYAHPRIRSFR